MVEYVVDAARARLRRARREPLGVALRSCAGSTGCCSAASAALVAYGLWAIAGITRHDVAGDPSYYVVRQGVFAALGARRPRRRARRSTRRSTAATGERDLRGHGRADGVRAARPARSRAARAAGSTSASSSSSRPSSGRCCSSLVLAGFLADRGRRIGECGTVLAAVGLALVADRCSSSSQPDLGTALVYAAALARRAVRRRRALAPPRRARRASRSPAPSSCSGAAGGRDRRAQAVPARAADRRSRTRTATRAGATYNIHAVDHRGRRGRRRGRGVAGRDADEPRLPARARHRLRVRLARRAARVRRRVGPAAASTCSSSGAGCRIDRGRAGRVLARSSPAASSSRSSSRSSSTSG